MTVRKTKYADGEIGTPKGKVLGVNIRTDETGLPLSGQIQTASIPIVINMPSFTVASNTISFDSRTDLSGVRRGDTFEDASSGTYTVVHVNYVLHPTSPIYDVTLDSVAAIDTSAGGQIYRSKTANALMVYDLASGGGGGHTQVDLFDDSGNPYTAANPLPVQLSDGSVNIGTVQANVEVQLTHENDYPSAGRIHDSIRIGDGTDELAIVKEGDDISVGTGTPHGVVMQAKDPSDLAVPLSVNASGELIIQAPSSYLEETLTVSDTGANEDMALSTNILDFSKASVQYVWSGLSASDATLQVEVSNDNSSWEPLLGSIYTLNPGAGGDTMKIQGNDMIFKYMRVVYDSGSCASGATVEAYVVAKA